MGERWATLFFVLLVLLASPSFAHKSPVIEYTYIGHIWEEAYTTIPRQPVISENIILKASVEHPNDVIEGEVTALFAVYQDDTTYEWASGKSYKQPNWLLITEAEGKPTGELNEFSSEVVIDRPGSYVVTIDWMENGQYIGQSMHMLDIETRTLGPLFLVTLGLTVLVVLVGVRVGVL